MTQAPTPGPLDSESVKLLVTGDLVADGDLIGALKGSADGWGCATIIAPNGAEFSRILHKGFAFVGRPDDDGWIVHDGSKNNPAVALRIDVWFRGQPDPALTRNEPANGWADFQWERIAKWRPTAFRLAPTAPVEASGSEREAIVEAIKVAMKDAWEDHASDTGCWPADIKRVSDRGPLRLMFTPSIWAQTTAEWAAETILRNRPQPSGETREAVAREVWVAFTGNPNAWDRAKDGAGPVVPHCWAAADRILALLSARPLALGGQQGEVRETIVKTIAFLKRDIDTPRINDTVESLLVDLVKADAILRGEA